MSNVDLNLANAPIVEAVVDIDCDMLPTFDLASREAEFRNALRKGYPKFRRQMLQGFHVEATKDAVPVLSTTSNGLQALQLLNEDEKQIVQMRAGGFTINRLAPYSNLDDYLSDIRSGWEVFTDIAKPVLVRQVQLRYINRLLLPTNDGQVDLDDYFTIGPKLPDEDQLGFRGFLHQHAMFEISSGNRVNTVLAGQPVEGDKLPVIFDITAQFSQAIEVQDWDRILRAILELRNLKNLVFRKTLRELCLNLYRQP